MRYYCDSIGSTVEPQFNWRTSTERSPRYNERYLRPGQSYSKMYGIGPRYNETRYNEFFDITNIIQRPKRKIYLDITNYNFNTGPTEDKR